MEVFHLLQFLAFIRTKKSVNKVQIYDQIYCLIEFPLKEFIQFSGVKSINQYQRNKYIEVFSDVQFQSLLVFPYVNIEKQANYWNVKIAVSKLLYESKEIQYFD